MGDNTNAATIDTDGGGDNRAGPPRTSHRLLLPYAGMNRVRFEGYGLSPDAVARRDAPSSHFKCQFGYRRRYRVFLRPEDAIGSALDELQLQMDMRIGRVPFEHTDSVHNDP